MSIVFVSDNDINGDDDDYDDDATHLSTRKDSLHILEYLDWDLHDTPMPWFQTPLQHQPPSSSASGMPKRRVETAGKYSTQGI